MKFTTLLHIFSLKLASSMDDVSIWCVAYEMWTQINMKFLNPLTSLINVFKCILALLFKSVAFNFTEKKRKKFNEINHLFVLPTLQHWLYRLKFNLDKIIHFMNCCFMCHFIFGIARPHIYIKLFSVTCWVNSLEIISLFAIWRIIR